MTKREKTKSFVMCLLFWACVVILAFKYTDGSSCVIRHESLLVQQILEKLWPR